ncbi:Fic family protein [Rhizobium lusitanum]|nr:Fic family protein [Rhizobium lusitanum]
MLERRVGQNALYHNLELEVIPPPAESWCGPTSRKTIIEGRRIIEKYPLVYAPSDTVAGHLKFALKHETLDMGVIAATMRAADPNELEKWVESEPTGAFSRRAWFLYEWFTGKNLNLPDASSGNYVDALNPKLNIGSHGTNLPRYRVVDNMLGVSGMCFTVKPSQAIGRYRTSALNERAQEIVNSARPEVLERAIQYLFTKETKSSFEIEHEEATAQKAERFVAALKSTASFEPSSFDDLIQLQNVIVDRRYAATAFRDFQNFVGETIGPDQEKVHFICPKPEDIQELMRDWGAMCHRLRGMSDPVIASAVVAFAFVYLHPFEDGNGRIHRFLIHNILSREGFTPPNFLFPISAAIVRDVRGYDRTLESLSTPVMERTAWAWDKEYNIIVKNDTDHLFRYFDATEHVEFTYAKIEDTVQKDLREEIDYITLFDAALKALNRAIDMPNRQASLFVRLFMQQGGISKKKRELFKELSDEEVGRLSAVVRDAITDTGHANDDNVEAEDKGPGW